MFFVFFFSMDFSLDISLCNVFFIYKLYHVFLHLKNYRIGIGLKIIYIYIYIYIYIERERERSNEQGVNLITCFYTSSVCNKCYTDVEANYVQRFRNKMMLNIMAEEFPGYCDKKYFLVGDCFTILL